MEQGFFTQLVDRDAGAHQFQMTRPLTRLPVQLFAAIMLGVAAGAAVSLGPAWAGFVALAALAAAVALLRSAFLGIAGSLLVITLLPFGALPFKVAITPTFLELMLIGVLSITVLRLLAVPEYDVRLTALGGPVLLFLGCTIFSLVIGANGLPDNLTLHNYVKFVLAVLLFFAVLNVVRTRDQMRWALRALVGGGAAAALIGIGLWLLNDQTALALLVSLGRIGYPTTGRVLRYVMDDPSGVERAIGTSVDPNSFGGMLAPIAAIAVTQILSGRSILPQAVLVVTAGVMAICIFLTQSRGALGGLVVAVIFLAIFQERRLWYVLGAAAIAAAVAYLVFGIGGQFVGRVTEGVQFQDQANQMRLAEYNNAIAIIRRYPVFGVGFGAGPELGLVTGVSSIYLAMAERIGLVGLAIFLLIMAIFAVRMFRALPALDEERRGWAIGVEAAVLAALAVGLLDHYYFNIEFSHMVALFWSMVGFGMAIPQLSERSDLRGA